MSRLTLRDRLVLTSSVLVGVGMAGALNVVGLMNVQFAIQGHGADAVVYVLEVNPRASRTVPFVSKATSLPLAKIAARCMAGRSLADQGVTRERIANARIMIDQNFRFAHLGEGKSLLLDRVGQIGFGLDYRVGINSILRIDGKDAAQLGILGARFLKARHLHVGKAVNWARVSAQGHDKFTWVACVH